MNNKEITRIAQLFSNSCGDKIAIANSIIDAPTNMVYRE